MAEKKKGRSRPVMRKDNGDDDDLLAGKPSANRNKPPFKKADKPAKKTSSVADEEIDFGVSAEEVKAENPAPAKKLPGTRFVTFGHTRKLRKKDIESMREWNENRRKMLDCFFVGQAEVARKKYADNSVYLGSETHNMVVGIPCPALAFEFVIGQDCFPLGLVIQLVAKPGVGKSALLAEFGRWFDMAGGGMSLNEAETKFNPEWYKSIMGMEAYNRMQLFRCSSVEDWQDKLTFAIKNAKNACIGTADAPGPGKTIPILLGVDSVMGKQSEETQEKIFGKKTEKGERGITGEGHATRSYPIEAQIITRYMRTLPAEIDNWPFSVVLVNHLRIKSDDMGNQERHKSGGDQLTFQESFEIELKKVGGPKKQFACSDYEGYVVELSCEKTSFASGHRKAKTRLLWWYETDENGSFRQHTVWDWDWATIDLLNTILNGDRANPLLRASLQEADFHLACPSSSDIENSAWSRTLGMTEEDAESWSTVGAMIRQDTDLMRRLRAALRISPRPMLSKDIFAPDVKSLRGEFA